ncbi:MAG: hypothetical protein IPJ81_15665 [Chitinophagaceae bacterium]|nr:hypothetical protein [Chitinophagaceae bacterium]
MELIPHSPDFTGLFNDRRLEKGGFNSKAIGFGKEQQYSLFITESL